MGEQNMERERELPRVSFIIPAFNSQRTIGRCLESLRNLDYPFEKLEVIVIDNGSKDGTPKTAARFGARVFVRPKIFVSEMRNYGAEQATGDVLAFVDSDCLICSHWLKGALEHLQDPTVGIAGCGYALDTSPGWIERHWFYMHLSSATPVTFVPAGNMAIKKSVFSGVGGFNPRLESGEDSDLCLRLRKAGLKIISDGALKNVHLGNPKSLSTFLRKEIWYGRGLQACISRDNWKDRTFLLANLFLMSLLLIIFGGLLLVFKSNPVVLSLGIAGVLFVITISTVYRTIRRGAFTSFVHLSILNTVYYFGRSISLLQIYLSLSKKLVKASK
jgi:glycosyltransferase involved in cell wall biosynthesis